MSTKFCKDCHWFNWIDNDTIGGQFCDKEPHIRNLVTGEIIRRIAKFQREGYGTNQCGIEARWFEPRSYEDGRKA